MTTDLEKALENGTAPWKEIQYRCKHFWIFSDEENAPTEEYLCFVPTYQKSEYLFETYKGAYKWGFDGMQNGKWQGFNIIQSVGIVAGQSIPYPYIHMLPRNQGDIDQ
jgi:hypothetical protein